MIPQRGPVRKERRDQFDAFGRKRRQEINELRATNRSLMPEGVEKEISVQQMADLLEFLKSR